MNSKILSSITEVINQAEWLIVGVLAVAIVTHTFNVAQLGALLFGLTNVNISFEEIKTHLIGGRYNE